MFGIQKKALNRPDVRSQHVLKTEPVSAKELATHMANKNAVLFGEELRRDTGKAYPFFYSFVPYPYLNTAQTNYGAPNVITTVVMGGEGPDGYTIPAADSNGNPGMRDILIRMDRDLNFDLLEVRYSVRLDLYASIKTRANYYPQTHHTASQASTNLYTQDGFPRLNVYPYKIAIPYQELVRVSVYVSSGQERSIYGGQTFINRHGDKSVEEVPVPITNLQGTDQGKNVMRTPYLIAKEGVVTVRVKNFFDTGMVLNGYLFGYKVAY